MTVSKPFLRVFASSREIDSMRPRGPELGIGLTPFACLAGAHDKLRREDAKGCVW